MSKPRKKEERTEHAHTPNPKQPPWQGQPKTWHTIKHRHTQTKHKGIHGHRPNPELVKDKKEKRKEALRKLEKKETSEHKPK